MGCLCFGGGGGGGIDEFFFFICFDSLCFEFCMCSGY